MGCMDLLTALRYAKTHQQKKLVDNNKIIIGVNFSDENPRRPRVYSKRD